MNNSKTSHLYNIYLLLFFVVLTLPLLSLPPFFHPPDFAKTSVMRGLFPFLSCIFLFQILFKKDLSRFQEIKKAVIDKKSAVFLPFWIFIAYFLVFALSAIFSLDIKTSLWDSPMRGGGFVIISFLILFNLLLLFILKPKDWQKVWDWSIAVGAVVALIAIFQKFSIFGNVLVGYADRPVSTMGGSIFLSLYLVLLTFLAVSFAILKKNKIRKALYIISVLLYLTAIAISATRAAFLGLAIGFLFFVFFFPSKSRKIFKIKIAFIILIIFSVICAFWLNTQPQLIQKLSDNKAIGSSFHRTWSMVKGFSVESIFSSRLSGWVIGLKALKDRPILGYGPENFSIAFDRYYDPLLPGINMTDPSQGQSGWWDRAHNFAVEIAVTAGIPALIIYFALFIVIFWKLQRVKKKNPEYSLISHGVQTAFLSYLIADFFGFDVFSTYLISFLLVAYSIFIIRESKLDEKENIVARIDSKIDKEEPFWKYVVLFFSLIIAVIFSWNYSLKPMMINRDLNIIEYWANVIPSNPNFNKNCQLALTANEKLLNEKKSVLDVYSRLVYINLIGGDCGGEAEKKGPEIDYKAAQRLEELMKLRPYYDRIWLFHIVYIYKIIDSDKNITSEAKEEFLKKALISYEKSRALSPGRQAVYAAGAKLFFTTGDSKKALEILDECLRINKDYPNCWWTKANILLRTGDIKGATDAVKLSLEKGYFDNQTFDTKFTLKNLINLYTDFIQKLTRKEKNQYYQVLAILYEKIIKISDPYPSFQDYASLAYVYRELGEYSKARENALKVLEISPKSKESVEEFLRSLPR